MNTITYLFKTSRHNLKVLLYCFSLLFLLSLTSYYLYITFKILINSDVSYPVFDNWRFFSELVDYAHEGKIISFITQQVNEHRPLILFSSMAIDYYYFGMHLYFMKAFHLISYLSLIFFILFVSLKTCNIIEITYTYFVKICSIISSLFLLLNMRQWEVHYGYTNVGTIQGFLFFSISVFLYNIKFEKKLSNHAYPLIMSSLIFAFLSEISMAFGLLTMPFIFLFSLIKKANRIESILLLKLSILYFIIYIYNMNLTPSGNNEWIFIFSDIVRIFYLSSLLIGSLFTEVKDNAFIIGVVGIIFYLLINYFYLFNKSINDNFKNAYLNTLMSLLNITIAYAIMVGIGRRHMIDEQAMVSRYMLTSAIFWDCLFIISINFSLIYFKNKRIFICLFYSFILLLIINSCIIMQKNKYHFMKQMVELNSIAVNGIQHDIIDTQTFGSLQILGMDEFYRLIDSLKKDKTSIYDSLIVNLNGVNILNNYKIDNNRCLGDFSIINRYELIEHYNPHKNLTGYKLIGWTWRKNDGAKPTHILLIDKEGFINGVSDINILRTDVVKALSDRSAKYSGWISFVKTSKTNNTLNGYALFKDENTICFIKSIKIENEKPIIK